MRCWAAGGLLGAELPLFANRLCLSSTLPSRSQRALRQEYDRLTRFQVNRHVAHVWPPWRCCLCLPACLLLRAQKPGVGTAERPCQPRLCPHPDPTRPNSAAPGWQSVVKKVAQELQPVNKDI